MRTVIGVDPSLSCTGVALWREGEVSTFSVKTKPVYGPRVVRERVIVERVLSWVPILRQNREHTTLIMIEAVFLQRLRGRTSLDLAGLHDVLVYAFNGLHIPVGVVAPTSLKQFATRDGRASKETMVADAKALMGVETENDNEADALWLAAMGVVAGGGRVNHWPPRSDHPIALNNQRLRAEVLSHVDWIGADNLPNEWLREQE